MKFKIFKLLFLTIFIIALVLRFNNSRTGIRVIPSLTPVGLVEKPESKDREIEIDGNRIIVTDVTGYKITEIPNFEIKETSDNIMGKYNCNVLINGGFYDTEYNPLGVYFLNGTMSGKIKKTSILNGILSVNSFGVFDISEIDTFDFNKEYQFYMQTGPIYYLMGKPYLNSINKNSGRRIIIAVDDNKNIYVIAMFDKNNYSMGPKYSEVSNYLYSFKEKMNLNIYNAVNLDGGNASLYIDKYYSIKESSLAGSFLCFKK